MKYRPPTKPATLDAGSMWASVAEVHRSDGFGPHERLWACEMVCYGSTEFAAREAAESWWDETRQSEECEVTISIERPEGTIVSHRFTVGMRIVARAVRQ